MKNYDVIVIGSGAGAIISDEAAEQDLKVALIDKGPLISGTCLSWGCIPSKMLIYTADRLVEIEEVKKLGIEAEIKNIDFHSSSRGSPSLSTASRKDSGLRPR